MDIGRKAADRCRELWRATIGVGDCAAQWLVYEPIVYVAPLGAQRPAERGCRAGSCSCGDHLYGGSGIDVRTATAVFAYREFGGGFRVRVDRDVDTEALQRVLELLRQR